jgi:hypothetical protein
MTVIHQWHQAAPGLVLTVGALLLIAGGLRRRSAGRDLSASVPGSATPDQQAYDRAFTDIVHALDRSAAGTPTAAFADQHDDVRRIASVLFCAGGLEPSVVSFSKQRTALHWGIAEDTVDIAVSVALLQTLARLCMQLGGPGPE